MIGVASVNAYCIYEVIYEEEEAKKMPGPSKRWFHTQFLDEFVYDFIYLGRSINLVADIGYLSITLTHALSIRSFAMFGQERTRGGSV